MQFDEKKEALRDIILRADLSATELRIYCYLLTQVMNATGHCCCSNGHLAKALGITLSSVHRAKIKLREKKLVTWTNLGKLAASAHLACQYNLPNRRGTAPTQLASTAPTQSALAAPAQSGLAAPTQLAQLTKFQKSRSDDYRSPPGDRDVVALSSNSSTAQKQWSKSAWRRQ